MMNVFASASSFCATGWKLVWPGKISWKNDLHLSAFPFLCENTALASFRKHLFGGKNDEQARLDSRYHSTRPYQRLESSGLGEDKRATGTKCTRCSNHFAAHEGSHRIDGHRRLHGA